MRIRKPDLNLIQAETEKLGVNPHITTGNSRNVEQGHRKTKESRWRQSYGNDRLDDFIFKYRLVMIVAWSVTVLYCTYRLYLAHYQFQDKIDVLRSHPSWLDSFLNRSKDTSDYEWAIFLETWTRYNVWKYYLGYIFVSRLCLTIYPKGLPWISLVFSEMLLVNELVGAVGGALLLTIPIILWIALMSRNRLVIAITSLLLITIFNNDIFNTAILIDSNSYYYGSLFINIMAGWIVARGWSYGFDTLKEDGATSFLGLLELIKYTFYFPLVVYGPLITYNTYRAGMEQLSCTPTKLEITVQETRAFLLKLLRVLFWAFFLEILLHYLYFKKIAWNQQVLQELDWWSLSAIVYWLGQFIQMKYVVIFGIPTAMAAYDGMNMPPLPKCTACIHRYSTLWRNFDRGMYYFLVQCIYLPVIEFMSKFYCTKNWNLVLKEFLSSLFTYAFVYIWHGNQAGFLVWVAINFLTVMVERVASGVKQMVDGKYNVTPVFWDMVVEPLVTIPLILTSSINSTIITGHFGTGQVIAQRFLTEWPRGIPVMFIVTNVGVAVRYWNGKKAKETNSREKSE